MKCAGCGAAFRKGKRRHVLQSSGDLALRRVCLGCASKAVAIVPVTRGAPCPLCPPGEARDATLCNTCANTLAHRAVQVALQPFAQRLRALATTYRLNEDPKHEGLDMAADILQEARM